MSYQLPQASDKSDGVKKKNDGLSLVAAKETDPLIHTSRSGGSIRARRSSKSPIDHKSAAHITPQGRIMIEGNQDDGYDGDHDGYESIDEANVHRRQPLQQGLQDDEESFLYPPPADSVESAPNRPDVPLQQTNSALHDIHSVGSVSVGSGSQPPVLEIPEEIYTVRKAALKVLKPLTRTWVRKILTVR